MSCPPHEQLITTRRWLSGVSITEYYSSSESCSRLYIPAYRAIRGGWFVAQDTGGAIIARHVDVCRPPPASPADGGRFLQDQRIYVVPPGG